jgi:hypothetical protein
MAKRRLDDFTKWKIEMLARFGGFAHRYIASVIFEKPLGRVTINEIRVVSGFLHRNKMKVSDWRRGRTPMAVAYAQKVTRPKAKEKKVLFPKVKVRKAA